MSHLRFHHIKIKKINSQIHNSKKMKNGSSPHVILLPYPSQGHINPLLQFAKRLSSKSIKATIATTHYTLPSIHVSSVSVEPISDGFDSAGFSQARDGEIFLDSFRENGSLTLSRLIAKHRASDFPITCVVYDSFLPWALDVARAHGVLGAAFFTNSAAVCAIFGYIRSGELRLPFPAADVEELVLTGLPPLRARDVPGFVREPESYPAYLAMKLGQFSNLDDADFVFGNSFNELEGEHAKSVAKLWPAKLIGPMIPSAYLDGRIEGDRGYGASLWTPLSHECTSWLKTKPPKSVIYVSFGSMVSLTSNQVQELAQALLDSNAHFLWALRETELEKLPLEFSKSEKGLVVSWCNQLEVLADPAVACFVTHCGWNSTLEGLSIGVPMVGMPQWADQMTDAKFVEVWGVGVRAKEDELGLVVKDEILRCLEEVMSEEIGRNVRKWSELAKRACDEGGSSDKAIDEFVMKLELGKGKGV